ncbi:MAG: hypothetical protein QOE33_3260 [Acidobacteriota bacterium]|nr:hypothetical protein [Acidobacteriota bacterium]
MEHPPFQASPLQLERYYIKECNFSVKESFVDKQGDYAPVGLPQILANVNESVSEDDPRYWRFEVLVESNDDVSKEFPYSLHVVLVGFFRVHESYPEERIKLLAKINGPSLLYSAAREALVTVTGRTGYPAVVLPSVMFIPPSPPKEEAVTVQKSLSSGEEQPALVDKGSGSKEKVTKDKATKSLSKADG